MNKEKKPTFKVGQKIKMKNYHCDGTPINDKATIVSKGHNGWVIGYRYYDHEGDIKYGRMDLYEEQLEK